MTNLVEPISAAQSRKLANMSLVCAFLVITHHFGVCKTMSSDFIWFWESFFRGGLDNVGGGLSWIAVPWFFLAAGYFLAGHIDGNGWWKRECSKRIRSLVIPFFVWCTLGVVLITCLDVFMHRMWYYNSATKVLAGIGFSPYNIPNPTASQLWFVRALVAFVIVSPIINKFLCTQFLIVLFLIYAIVAPFDSVTLYRVFRYGFSLEGLFYFSLGMYLRYHPIHIRHIRSLGIVFFVLGAVCVLMPLFISGMGMEGGYVQWIGTPFLLFSTWALVPSTPLPQWLVRSSFPIYLMHRIVILLFQSFSRNLSVMQCSLVKDASLLSWLLVASLAFAVPIAVAVLLRNFAPRIAMIIFGGR